MGAEPPGVKGEGGDLEARVRQGGHPFAPRLQATEVLSVIQCVTLYIQFVSVDAWLYMPIYEPKSMKQANLYFH